MQYQIKRKETLISYLIGSAFLFSSICLLMNILFPSITGFGEIFVILLLLVGFFLCFPRMRIDINLLILNLFLLAFILVSYFYYDMASVISGLLQNYVVWGIGITILMMQHYNLRITLNFTFFVSCLIIICELISNAHINYESMTWAYSIFPCVATVIVHFYYCRFKGKLKLLYIPGIVMLIKFIAFSNRGGIVSLAMLIYLVSIKAINSRDYKLKNKTLLNLLLLILLVFAVLFFEQIVGFFFHVTTASGYEISAIQKMYMLIQSGNVTNNRSELYVYALEGFIKSPIWGNGVGSFSVIHGGWVHNFILQVLYEGGLLLFFVIMIPLIRIFCFFVFGTHIGPYEYSFFVLLFSTSIPRLLFSTELWNTQAFWMLLAFGIIYFRKSRQNKEV